jgi:hypothetical protein
MATVPLLSGTRYFSFTHNDKIGSGDHYVLYQIGFRGVQWQRNEADHSTPYSVKLHNGGAELPLPPYVSMP